MLKFIGFALGFLFMTLFVLTFGAFIIQFSWAHSITPMFNIREPSLFEAFFLGLLTNTLCGGLRVKATTKDK